MMRTGDYPIVDEWTNNIWPEEAKQAIQKFIPDYMNSVVMRTATTNITISFPLKETAQLIINYHAGKKCFLIWNAAIQETIHKGKEVTIPFGKKLSEELDRTIAADALIPIFKEIGSGGSGKGELILIVGEKAFPNFCKTYKERIKPDISLIPKGKECLYAEAGGTVQHIKGSET